MPYRRYDVEDQEKYDNVISAIAASLDIPEDSIESYFIMALDGTPELKVGSDMEDVNELVALAVVFIEQVTGRKVAFED
jgi:hypothetical protein